MVSASPSSAERMMTLPSGARPSPHGHSPPVVIAPMIAIEIWLFPAPGSPAMHVCLPRAMRPGQSHSMGSGSISDARREMSARPFGASARCRSTAAPSTRFQSCSASPPWASAIRDQAETRAGPLTGCESIGPRGFSRDQKLLHDRGALSQVRADLRLPKTSRAAGLRSQFSCVLGQRTGAPRSSVCSGRERDRIFPADRRS